MNRGFRVLEMAVLNLKRAIYATFYLSQALRY